MIIALLFLILFAILFPRALKFLFALMFIGGIVVLSEPHAKPAPADFPVKEGADGFPAQDVETVCRQTLSYNYLGNGRYSGEASQPMINDCIDFVQPYYDSAKQSWNVASSTDREECLTKANAKASLGSYYGFYVFLSQCFNVKEQQADMKRTRHFNAW